MRALLGCGLLLLAACQAREEPGQPGTESAQKVDDSTIECALDGASEFKRVCEVERIKDDDRAVWVIRHPDGSFRRFQVRSRNAESLDGIVTTADGADEASVTWPESQYPWLNIAVDNDRYRFPVTLKTDDPAK